MKTDCKWLKGEEKGDDMSLKFFSSSSKMSPKQIFYFLSRLHNSCRFGVNWQETGRFLILSCVHVVAIYTSRSDSRAALGCICHRYYRESPMWAGPWGCGQFTGCERRSQATTLKSVARKSPALNPMEAIKPFIFNVWASWLSYSWRRRDSGPTAQEPLRNYSAWIIHRTWGRYLLKGQTCLCIAALLSN